MSTQNLYFLGIQQTRESRDLNNGQEKEKTKPVAALPTVHTNRAKSCLYYEFPSIVLQCF